MLTKKQLDSLGLRQIGRDDKGRLEALAAELIEVDEQPELAEELASMTAEEIYNLLWLKKKTEDDKKTDAWLEWIETQRAELKKIFDAIPKQAPKPTKE